MRLPTRIRSTVPFITGVTLVGAILLAMWRHRAVTAKNETVSGAVATELHLNSLPTTQEVSSGEDVPVPPPSGANQAGADRPYQDRLFGSLRTGQRVVLGSVREIEAHAYDNKNIRLGRIVLDVRTWLRGTGTARLTLPYAYNSGFVPHLKLDPVWPIVEKLDKGQPLICVFNPDEADRSPEKAIGRTASIVWEVSGYDDPIIPALKKVIALDDERKAADWEQNLIAGLKDSESLVRQYCVDAVARDISNTEPEAAVVILTGHLGRAAEIHASEIVTDSILGHITAILQNNALAQTPQMPRKAVHAFALIAANKKLDERIRRDALNHLAQLLDRPRMPTPADVFDQQERARVLVDLPDPVKPKNPWEDQQLAAVRQWLEASGQK